MSINQISHSKVRSKNSQSQLRWMAFFCVRYCSIFRRFKSHHQAV